MIRPVTPADAADICALYNQYIRDSIITFEDVPLTEAQMAARIAGVGPLRPWLVYEENGQVKGYAYAGEWKSRGAYRYTAETTIYLHPDLHRQGVGRRLYQALFDDLRATPVRALIAGIALPNAASVGLHEALGFRKIGHFHEVGYKFGNWIDVGYWQLLLPGPAPVVATPDSKER